MIDWIANEGILIRAIREFLAGLASLTLHQQQLRDEVLTPSSSGFGPRQNERQLTTGPAGSTQQPTVDGNTALWTLPVTIAVSVGSPSGPPVATSTAPPDPPLLGGGPIDQPSVAPTVDDGDQDDEELLQSDVDQAVAEFQNAASRVYYDAQADDEDRRRYYSSISESLSPAQLYDALSRLSKAKHTTRLGYKPSRHLYPWVDLRPDLTIASVYSGQSFDPVELIEADYQTAEMRRERLAEFRLNESAGDPMTPADFYDSLESSLRFNCEHCVPQSWYSKRQPMRGDLHHLFACEPRCNSFRGNMPYFDFSDYREAIRSDCGKSESRKFEPNAGNGFVARATLYFIIRYPSVIKRTNAQYPTSRLEVLLDWHRQFPLTEYERHRNQAIFAMQGNRNPLIDYPDWADQIDFSQGIS